jgi:hypothetical protein
MYPAPYVLCRWLMKGCSDLRDVEQRPTPYRRDMMLAIEFDNLDGGLSYT